jgi:hypothetical protein
MTCTAYLVSHTRTFTFRNPLTFDSNLYICVNVGGGGSAVASLPLIRSLRLVRLVKIARVIKMSGIMDSLEKVIFIPSICLFYLFSLPRCQGVKSHISQPPILLLYCLHTITSQNIGLRPGIVNLFKLFTLMLLFSHLIACCLYAVADCNNNECWVKFLIRCSVI